jgi:hypothetical protein
MDLDESLTTKLLVKPGFIFGNCGYLPASCSRAGRRCNPPQAAGVERSDGGHPHLFAPTKPVCSPRSCGEGDGNEGSNECGDAAANLSAVSMTDWRKRPRTPKGQARPPPERGGPDWDEAIDRLKAMLAELYETKDANRHRGA